MRAKTVADAITKLLRREQRKRIPDMLLTVSSLIAVAWWKPWLAATLFGACWAIGIIIELVAERE